MVSKWYLTSHTTATIASTETLKNETWLVRVTPTDGITNGPFVESSVTLINTPPTMSSISVSPTSPTTQDNVTCSYSGSDVDPSDNLTYVIEWIVNNTLVSGSTDTLLGPLQGDVVTCRVTPNDGATSEPSLRPAQPLSIQHPYTVSFISACQCDQRHHHGHGRQQRFGQ